MITKWKKIKIVKFVTIKSFLKVVNYFVMKNDNKMEKNQNREICYDKIVFESCQLFCYEK